MSAGPRLGTAPGHAARGATARAVPGDHPERAVRVVVVDDNDDLRRLIGKQIDRLGDCQVVGTAADGVEAIEVAASLRPDLLFLDLSMPGMGGLEALPHILRVSPATRVVVLSANDTITHGGDSIAAGAAAFAEKNFRIDYRALVDSVLGGVDRPGPR